MSRQEPSPEPVQEPPDAAPSAPAPRGPAILTVALALLVLMIAVGYFWLIRST